MHAGRREEMTIKECYAALGLNESADLAEIKRAYRRLAFSLHPDLNPAIRDAAHKFQRVNEAYVTLSRHAETNFSKSAASDDASARAREEANKAYSKAKAGQKDAGSGPSPADSTSGAGKESVLKDILNDPFARRVFEDIYSHIREEGRKNTRIPKTEDLNSRPKPSSGNAGHKSKATPGHFEDPPEARAETGGVMDKMKGWLRRQIDDEQVLRLPGASLVPGARVRLEIQHGLTGEPQVIELTLPPEFKPGKAMRLRGMGKKIGNWKGDLYVRIEPV